MRSPAVDCERAAEISRDLLEFAAEGLIAADGDGELDARESEQATSNPGCLRATGIDHVEHAGRNARTGSGPLRSIAGESRQHGETEVLQLFRRDARRAH